MNALIVTFDKCPNKDAGAVRLHMFASILNQIGYRVVVISMGDHLPKKGINVENVTYISFRSKGNSKLNRFLDYIFFPLKLLLHLFAHQYNLCMHTQLEVLNAIILKKYCKKREIPIIFDAVEWFSAEQFKKGEKSLGYKMNNYYNTKLIDKQYGVVSISSYLNEHFKSKGIRTVEIPVILDVNSMPTHIHNDSDKVALMYAGSPGKKDYLATIINALTLLKQNDLDKLTFTIIGVTEEQLVTSCGVKSDNISQLKNCLNIKGRIPRNMVLEELTKADFTILIRSEKLRYAKAGFPTKFVESLALGTPVIANLTSDLEHYLIDNKNGMIVNSNSEESICLTIKKVINLSDLEKKDMCKEAKKTATNFFDYRLFIAPFKAFIQTIEKGES